MATEDTGTNLELLSSVVNTDLLPAEALVAIAKLNELQQQLSAVKAVVQEFLDDVGERLTKQHREQVVNHFGHYQGKRVDNIYVVEKVSVMMREPYGQRTLSRPVCSVEVRRQDDRSLGNFYDADDLYLWPPKSEGQ